MSAGATIGADSAANVAAASAMRPRSLGDECRHLGVHTCKKEEA